MVPWHERVQGVWFDDLDPYGVLHNMRYLALVERTLSTMWRSCGLGGFRDRTEHAHLVRANHIEYLRPVRGPGHVRVRTWFQALGRTSMTYGFVILPMDDDAPCAVGTRTVVCIDKDSERPVPWTDGLRAAVTPQLWAPADAPQGDAR